MEKTVPRNVSVTTMAFVCHLLDSASVALDTQENGARMSVPLVLMVLPVQRHVIVKTTASATTAMECVFVSQDTQERHVMSDCVLKESMACVAIGNVRAMSKALVGM